MTLNSIIVRSRLAKHSRPSDIWAKLGALRLELAMDIPGTSLEKAAGKVLTAAGKSIVNGMEKLAGASLGEWMSSKEAKAEAAQLAIETQAQIDKEKALQEHRRQSEAQELEHRAVLGRRAIRFRAELIREQTNLESIAMRAIEYTGKGETPEEGREIDEDWMFRFAEFSQRVSDKDVQDLWASVLSKAATAGNPKLSAAALQTMSLLDKETAIDFQQFCAVVGSFRYYPAHDRVYDLNLEVQNIDLRALKELGLIEDQATSDPYHFSGFKVSMTTNRFTLNLMHTNFFHTKRGADIGNAVFNPVDLTLSDSIRHIYIQRIIATQIEIYNTIALIASPRNEGEISPFRIILTHPKDNTPVQSDLDVLGEISDDLRATLIWASSRYDIAVENNI
jgi:hypothetical protein